METLTIEASNVTPPALPGTVNREALLALRDIYNSPVSPKLAGRTSTAAAEATQSLQTEFECHRLLGEKLLNLLGVQLDLSSNTYLDQLSLAYGKLSGYLTKVALKSYRAELVDYLTPSTLTEELIDLASMWHSWVSKPAKQNLGLEHIFWAKLGIVFYGGEDLCNELDYWWNNEYAGPYEIKYAVRQSANPRAELEAKVKLYGELLSEFKDSPYAGPTEIKWAVRTSANPRAELEAKAKLYGELLDRCPNLSAAAIRYFCRASSVNREEASRRFDYRLNSAENFAKNNGISLNLAFWLTCFSDSEARLIAYLDFQNISKPVSLDRGRSDSDKRDGYNFNPAKSTDQEATEAKLRLGKIIKASGLSEEDLEALMSEIVDGGIGVDSLSKRSSELLEALREAAR